MVTTPHPDDHLEQECPFPCELCPGPGNCEDCLHCLLWPKTVEEVPTPPWSPRARATPLRAKELALARLDLTVGRIVGLVLRRARGRAGLSQSAMALRIGWSSSSLDRAERDASKISLERTDDLLRHVGHRLIIVTDDPPEPPPDQRGELSDPHATEVLATAFGTDELLARDRRGRRFPPFARLTWEDPSERRLYERHGRPLPEWTWTRPQS
ncbi:helix-turn-helix domain-containing protein [Janibacter anophelis]|uniref:helix-turn-helix domain-containing protein n=1 Tax=Janibacter anophelis TaxID=319054 RepID=UPI003F7E0E68